MTWNLETPEPPAQTPEIVDRIQALEFPEGDRLIAEQDQLDAAKVAAISLIESGAIGRTGPDGGYFAATFAGVGHPGHEPSDGGPTDRITVEVRQVVYEPPPEPVDEEAEDGEEAELEQEAPEQELAPA